MLATMLATMLVALVRLKFTPENGPALRVGVRGYAKSKKVREDIDYGTAS